MKRHVLQMLSGLLLLTLLAPGLAAVSARPPAASNVTLAEIDLGLAACRREHNKRSTAPFLPAFQSKSNHGSHLLAPKC